MARGHNPLARFNQPRGGKIRLPLVFRQDAEDETELQLLAHNELSRLRDGSAAEDSWHTITARLNIGKRLAYSHFNTEAVDALSKALDAMVGVWKRHEEKQRWGGTGDELIAIGDGLNLTDDMQKQTTRRQLAEAIRYVYATAGMRSVAIGQMVKA